MHLPWWAASLPSKQVARGCQWRPHERTHGPSCPPSVPTPYAVDGWCTANQLWTHQSLSVRAGDSNSHNGPDWLTYLLPDWLPWLVSSSEQNRDWKLMAAHKASIRGFQSSSYYMPSSLSHAQHVCREFKTSSPISRHPDRYGNLPQLSHLFIFASITSALSCPRRSPNWVPCPRLVRTANSSPLLLALTRR